MSIDSPWLAGEFEGIAVADHQIFGGRLRAQFFGDLGPKVADLTVQWGRIVGFFPQTREGIDCWLPREASPHPLLFIGASLAEELLERDTPGRVLGIREEPEGAWLQLRSYIAGTEIHRFMSRKDPKVKKRRYWWMTGVHWEEEWISPSECLISAPSVTIRVRIRERGTKAPATPFPMDLILPEDVRIVAGSRK